MPTWHRSQGVWKTAHFKAKEAECRCGICSMQMISDDFLLKLEELRQEYGAPIRINSGYRCQLKQDQLRKQGYETAKGISSHTQGIACDVSGSDMAALEAACLKVFANFSVGVAKTFIHVDQRSGGPRRWSYKG